MGRVVWTTIASKIRRQYIEEDGKCKVCGEVIPLEESLPRTLSNIYKHFKEKHPEIVEEIKQSL